MPNVPTFSQQAWSPGHAEDGVAIGSAPNQAIGVLLVDARTMLREALAGFLDQQPDVDVVAQADTVAAATTTANDTTAVDVVVTEIDLSEGSPTEVVAALRRSFPSSAILALTFANRPGTVQAALAAGAGGFILKTATTADLLTAIHALGRGETYLQPSLGAELARGQSAGGAAVLLSPKEEQVLRLLALGHTNAEVAKLSGVSVRTVETHRSRIHQKLGRQTRAELVRYAIESGLLFGDA